MVRASIAVSAPWNFFIDMVGDGETAVAPSPTDAPVVWSESVSHGGKTVVPSKASPSVKAGLRYEKKVLERLASGFLPDYSLTRQHIFHYRLEGDARSKIRKAIVDGVLWSRSGERQPIIVEVKYTHHSDTFGQALRYREILAKMGLGYNPKVLEICRSFPPGIKAPCEYVVLPNWASAFNQAMAPFGKRYIIFVWDSANGEINF